MTFIWSYINTNFQKSWNESILTPLPATTLSDFTDNFSTALNNAWAPAWNVFVVYLTEDYFDSVLYGYAFRDHWMWYNGYILNDNTYVTFIIWKDYNCFTWNSYHSLRNSGINTFTGDDATAVESVFEDLPWENLDRIWQVGFEIV